MQRMPGMSSSVRIDYPAFPIASPKRTSEEDQTFSVMWSSGLDILINALEETNVRASFAFSGTTSQGDEFLPIYGLVV
jgi:hypothetical protein